MEYPLNFTYTPLDAPDDTLPAHICHVDERGVCRKCHADAHIAVLKTMRHNHPDRQLSPLGEMFAAELEGKQ